MLDTTDSQRISFKIPTYDESKDTKSWISLFERTIESLYGAFADSKGKIMEGPLTTIKQSQDDILAKTTWNDGLKKYKMLAIQLVKTLFTLCLTCVVIIFEAQLL
ncbi:hypothetical protein BDA99DRAFT_568987 [Phascolomyces articulosus]|uniref:Uncharacterized protein n=1 Tax=Phascolomyces articulosus TaxID=60185 RepID=A0AAD5K725_9FUNG|nr:hypothetical protein BDA99DRAFT_568987 [Phascolomyces articulosus]